MSSGGNAKAMPLSKATSTIVTASRLMSRPMMLSGQTLLQDYRSDTRRPTIGPAPGSAVASTWKMIRFDFKVAA